MDENSSLMAGVLSNVTANDTEPFDIEKIMGPRREPLGTAIAMSLMYAVILATGVVGNVCTCTVIARNRYMHTATNYYLFSLAVSDLLLLILGLPQDMYQLWSKYPYIFGEFFCIVRGWTSETSTNASILTITAFTVERYLAICHPLRAHTMSRLSRAVKFVIVIWVCAALIAISQGYQLGIVYEMDAEGQTIMDTAHCGIKRPLNHSFEASTFVFFVFPSTVLSALYILIGLQLRKSSDIGRKHNGQASVDSNGVKGQGKSLNALQRKSTRKNSTSSRKAVVKMLVAVVVAFFLCWAPFHAQRLMAVYITEPTEDDYRVFNIITNISGVTYYVSATINPILYSIMSLKFRHAFKETLGRFCGRKKTKKDHQRMTSIYNSTLRSGGYEATELTVVSECPHDAGQKKGTMKRAISNSSLQMMDEGAFDEVNITEYIDDGESR